MIVPFAKLTQATFMVASKRPLAVRYHWVGRSVMCPGVDCPACILRSPKTVYYFAAHYQKQMRICEVCPSLVNALERLATTFCLECWNGIAVEAKRSNNRCPWVFSRTDYRKDAAGLVPETDVALAIANVYRLPPPREGETFMTWHTRVVRSQIQILQACQLV